MSNAGGFVKSGYAFVGWTLSADGSGTVYKNGDKLTMGASDVTLYAKWEIDAGGVPDPVAAPKLSSLQLSAGVWSTAFASETTAYT
ncbi:InlB B-repeat-containing protein, partial [Marinobacter sp. 71-i]